MIESYKGPYQYKKTTLEGWNDKSIGVYYCLASNRKTVLYVGKGAGDAGMKGRLLDHLRDDYWPDALYFGFKRCSSVSETENYEASEIKRYQPKYNVVGK